MSMKNVKNVILGVLALLIVIIIFQNMQSVETRILFLSITMPRALLLIVTFLSGLGLGAAVTRGLGSNLFK